MSNTYHEGERDAQTRAGSREEAQAMEGSIRAEITPGIARFLSERTYAFVAAADAHGAIWTTMLEARTDLLRPMGTRLLALKPVPRADDPVLDALRSPTPIAILAIDFATRRRLRVNGFAVPRDDETIVSPIEIFGNCPKYIPKREVEAWADVAPGSYVHASVDEARQVVASADCFALATLHPTRGLDVSHRGGSAGFIDITPAGELTWPDYPGNGMFQSIGNLLVDPRAAIAIPDFERRGLLFLTGAARLDWISPAARRYTFRPSQVRWIEHAISQRFGSPTRWPGPST